MLTAIINEAHCIGCSRCIPACPVDAIIGSPQYLHTVLQDECIGCRLCVAPCPVDCIEIVPQTLPIDKQQRALKAKHRYQARQLRLQKQAQRQLPVYASAAERQQTIRNNIAAALARVKAKRNLNYAKHEPSPSNQNI